MKHSIAKILSLGLVAAALTLIPAVSHAEDTSTNAPATLTPKKHGGLPFQGAVKAVDTKAETITVGKQTYNVTSATKIVKAADKTPAKLSDVTVGAMVTGSYVKDADGKLTLHSLKINAKDKTKKKKASTTDSSTNSVSSTSN